MILFMLLKPNDLAQLTGNAECSAAKRRIDWSTAAPCYVLYPLKQQ